MCIRDSFYWEDKLEKVSDRLLVSARDSRYESKEYIPYKLDSLLKQEKKIDRVVAIGCTYLMYRCAEATRPAGVKTMVSLNPIMVDGTGMCGSCRVTVDGKTKFACVDGPDFDGHTIDWPELFSRRKSYFDDEVKSLCAFEKERF